MWFSYSQWFIHHFTDFFGIDIKLVSSISKALYRYRRTTITWNRDLGIPNKDWCYVQRKIKKTSLQVCFVLASCSEHISGAWSKLYLKKTGKTKQKSSDLSEPHSILTKVIVYAIVVTSEGSPLILNTTLAVLTRWSARQIEPAMISRYWAVPWQR